MLGVLIVNIVAILVVAALSVLSEKQIGQESRTFIVGQNVIGALLILLGLQFGFWSWFYSLNYYWVGALCALTGIGWIWVFNTKH